MTLVCFDSDLLGVGGVLFTLAVYACGVLSALGFFHLRAKAKNYEPVEAEPQELLHWFPDVDRRGIGDAIQRINHIAIIVADVGRSLAFYTEVMGFQQIRRPNFDRHGAWLTVGNTELHLIKGQPCVHDGEDLIVSHIALDTERPLEVLEKLVEMNIPFRQNVSVPDPLKSGNNREEDFSSASGKVIQFFVRDPDGYYLEICNCDILTKFCLMKQEKINQMALGHYSEGLPCEQKLLSMGYIAKIMIRMKRMKRRVRANLLRGYAECLEEQMEGVERAHEVDMAKLEKLAKRQKTYCDIIQGFTKVELAEALLMAGNSVPLAVLILKTDRGGIRPAIPPSYFAPRDTDDIVTKPDESLQPRRFYVEVVRPHSQGSEGLARACKPFNDRKPSKECAARQLLNTEPNAEAFKGRIGSKTSCCSASTRSPASTPPTASPMHNSLGSASPTSPAARNVCSGNDEVAAINMSDFQSIAVTTVVAPARRTPSPTQLALDSIMPGSIEGP
jgi:catechol 2,3-dioxygenase-like lactoylglutathione lyase family enzyme